MQRKSLVSGGVIALTAALVFSGCQQVPQRSPEEVVKAGMKNLVAVTSHEFDLSVNGDLKGPQGEKPEKVAFKLSLGGSADLKDSKDPKINLKFDGSGNADEQNASGAAEIRLNKEAVYFTLSKLASSGGEVPKEFVDLYVGKWWMLPIPPEALQEITSTLPEGGSQESMTPEQKRMKELFEGTQFFKNIKFVAMEDVKGAQSYHYSAELDKEAFAAFAIKAAAEQGQEMTDTDKADMQAAMKKFDFVGNVWVTKDGEIMNQVSGDVKLVGATDEPSGTVTVKLSLWNFNKPVTVAAPAGAQEFPVQELMGALMGGVAPTDLSGADASLSLDGSTLDAGTSSVVDGGVSVGE